MAAAKRRESNQQCQWSVRKNSGLLHQVWAKFLPCMQLMTHSGTRELMQLSERTDSAMLICHTDLMLTTPSHRKIEPKQKKTRKGGKEFSERFVVWSTKNSWVLSRDEATSPAHTLTPSVYKCICTIMITTKWKIHVPQVHMVWSRIIDVEPKANWPCWREGIDQGNSFSRIHSIHERYVNMTMENSEIVMKILGSLSTENSSPFLSSICVCTRCGNLQNTSLRSTIVRLQLTYL